MEFNRVPIKASDKVWFARPDGDEVSWIVLSQCTSLTQHQALLDAGYRIIGHEPVGSIRVYRVE